MTLSAIAQMRHDAVLDSGWWEDAVVRLDDANFTEDKHPRGPDGKFIKGSGTKLSTKSFMQAMKKAGKTATKSALIKHLLSGGHHQDDVIEAVKDEFPSDSAAVDKAYVKYYHNQLSKVTPALPPLKPGSSGEKYHGEAEPTTLEEPKPTPVEAQPMQKLSSDSKKFLSDEVEKYIKSQVPGAKEKYHAVIAALNTKGSVEDQQNAVGKLETFPNPVGALQKSLNKFIEKAQLDYGVQKLQSSVPTASIEHTPAQQKKCQDGVYHALIKAPPKKMHMVTYHQDASGNEVGAVLKADTSKIPGDHYSKVTAAYGLDPNPTSLSVSSAMAAYGQHMSTTRPDEVNSAIISYQGTGYNAINKALLNPEASHSPTVKKQIQHVANSIASEYLPADTPLVRGLKCTLKDLAGFDTVAESVGRVFEHKNFCSASREKYVAEKFAGSRNRVMLHFTAPAGCNALVMAHGQMGGESETVLPKNCMFRIDKIEKSTDSSGYDVHKVHCTYLGVKENG